MRGWCFVTSRYAGERVLVPSMPCFGKPLSRASRQNTAAADSSPENLDIESEKKHRQTSKDGGAASKAIHAAGKQEKLFFLNDTNRQNKRENKQTRRLLAAFA